MTIIVSISAIAGRRLVLQRPAPCFSSGEVSLVATITVGEQVVRTHPQPVVEDPILGLTVTFRDALTIEVPESSHHGHGHGHGRSSGAGTSSSSAALTSGVEAMTCEFTVVTTKESTGVATVSLSKRWMRLEPLGGEALVSFSICRIEHPVVQNNLAHPESWAALHRANVEDTKRAVTNYASDRQLRVRVLAVEGLSLPLAHAARIRWAATFAMLKSTPSETVATSAHYHPIAGSNAETAFFHKATFPGSAEPGDSPTHGVFPAGGRASSTASAASSTAVAAAAAGKAGKGAEGDAGAAVFLVHANNCSSELTVHIEVVPQREEQESSPASSINRSAAASPTSAGRQLPSPISAASALAGPPFEAARASCDLTELLHSRGAAREVRDLHFAGSVQHRFSIVTVELRIVPIEAESPFVGLPARDRALMHPKAGAASWGGDASPTAASQEQQQQQQAHLHRALSFSAGTYPSLSAGSSRRQSVAAAGSGLTMNLPTSLVAGSSFYGGGALRGQSSSPSGRLHRSGSVSPPSARSPQQMNISITTPRTRSLAPAGSNASLSSQQQQQMQNATAVRCFDSLTLSAQVKIEESITAAVENAMSRVMRRFDEVLGKVAAVEERVTQLVRSSTGGGSPAANAPVHGPAASSSTANMMSPRFSGFGASSGGSNMISGINVITSESSYGSNVAAAVAGLGGSTSGAAATGGGAGMLAARRASRRGSTSFGRWQESQSYSGVFAGGGE